jgi:hypothetical protein
MIIINEKIKELYGSKSLFSEKLGINPKDYSSKFRTLENRIEFVNEFLEHLNLEIEINETPQQ